MCRVCSSVVGFKTILPISSVAALRWARNAYILSFVHISAIPCSFVHLSCAFVLWLPVESHVQYNSLFFSSLLKERKRKVKQGLLLGFLTQDPNSQTVKRNVNLIRKYKQTKCEFSGFPPPPSHPCPPHTELTPAPLFFFSF